MRDLIQSKKFRTMTMSILGIVVLKVAGLKGVVLDEATAKAISEMVFGLASAYLLAQGAADWGKEGKAADLLGKLDQGGLAKLIGGAVEAAKTVSADDSVPKDEDGKADYASGKKPDAQ